MGYDWPAHWRAWQMPDASKAGAGAALCGIARDGPRVEDGSTPVFCTSCCRLGEELASKLPRPGSKLRVGFVMP